MCLALPSWPSSDSRDADKARTEQRQGCRLGHFTRDFGDDHLAIANLKIGYQDLVRTRVEGAAAAAEAKRGGSRAATTSAVPTTTTAGTVAATTTAAEPTVAADEANAASEIGKPGTTAGAARIAPASTEKAAATTAPINTSFAPGAIATALAAGDAASAAPVRASEAASTGREYAGAAAGTGNDQRGVVGANHEGAAAAGTAEPGSPRASHGNLQNIARSQTEVATYLGTQTSPFFAIPALRAKSEGLISVAYWHHEGNKTSGIGELKDDGRSVGNSLPPDEPQECRPRKQKLSHRVPPQLTGVINYGIVL
jgi:hypothetical protein